MREDVSMPTRPQFENFKLRHWKYTLRVGVSQATRCIGLRFSNGGLVGEPYPQGVSMATRCIAIDSRMRILKQCKRPYPFSLENVKRGPLP